MIVTPWFEPRMRTSWPYRPHWALTARCVASDGKRSASRASAPSQVGGGGGAEAGDAGGFGRER